MVSSRVSSSLVALHDFGVGCLFTFCIQSPWISLLLVLLSPTPVSRLQVLGCSLLWEWLTLIRTLYVDYEKSVKFDDVTRTAHSLRKVSSKGILCVAAVSLRSVSVRWRLSCEAGLVEPHLLVSLVIVRFMLSNPRLPWWGTWIIAPVWAVRSPAISAMLRGPFSCNLRCCWYVAEAQISEVWYPPLLAVWDQKTV